MVVDADKREGEEGKGLTKTRYSMGCWTCPALDISPHLGPALGVTGLTSCRIYPALGGTCLALDGTCPALDGNWLHCQGARVACLCQANGHRCGCGH